MNGLLTALLLGLLPAQDEKVTYYFGSSDARTNITFQAKTDIATIVGSTHKVSGRASIDAKAGTHTTHLIVPVASLRTGMVARDRVLRRKGWLDAETYPNLEFKAEKAKETKPSVWSVDGTFTMHGVTKPMSITVEAREIPDALAKRAKLGPGKWIRVKTSFRLKLSDYGIKIPSQSIATVDDVWTVKITIFGTTEKPPEVKPPDKKDAAFAVLVPKVKLEGAAGTRYRFGLKQQLTTLTATSETELGTIRISSSVLGGLVAVEKDAGRVKLKVPVASLTTGIVERDHLLRSAKFLDAARHANIEFESTKASLKDKSWTIEGTLTIRGKSRPITVTVTMREITKKQMWDAGWGRKPGLGFSGKFTITLSEFGVLPGDLAEAKLEDAWAVSFDLVALRE